MTPLGERPLLQLVEDWHPTYSDDWKRWIRESYVRYTSNDEGERLLGAKDFATILGDSGAPELCVLVALHGLELAKADPERKRLDADITIVASGLGLVRYKEDIPPGEGIPCTDFADRTKWLINRKAWEHWRDQKLQELGGDRRSAADFCVRLACVRAGVLTGAVEPTFDALRDASLWHLARATVDQWRGVGEPRR